MSNIDPHLHILLSLAGASETDERIDIHNFSDKVTAEVNKILKSKKLLLKWQINLQQIWLHYLGMNFMGTTR